MHRESIWRLIKYGSSENFIQKRASNSDEWEGFDAFFCQLVKIYVLTKEGLWFYCLHTLLHYFSYWRIFFPLFIILVFRSLRIFLSNLRDIVRPKRKRNRHFFFDFPFYEFLRLVVETTRSRSWATFASPSFLFLLFPPTNKRQYGTNSVASSLGFVAVPRSEWNSVGLSINHFVVVILCPNHPTSPPFSSRFLE